MNSEFKVMITGSFDPITEGHMDIIERCSRLFPVVYVVMFINSQKKYLFEENKRLELIKKSCSSFPNVKVDFSRGMVVDYVKEHNISAIVRGIRGDADIEYEKNMAEFNSKHGGVETLFLPANPRLADCSSTQVRRLLSEGKTPTDFIPESIIEDVLKGQ